MQRHASTDVTYSWNGLSRVHGSRIWVGPLGHRVPPELEAFLNAEDRLDEIAGDQRMCWARARFFAALALTALARRVGA